MNIYQKMAEVMKDVQYLAKDDRVKFKETNYKAISEEKVTRTMREALLKHGLVVFPVEQERSRVGTITSVDVKYRIQNIDDPDDYITVVSSGDGADTQDKGAGKAMTYAYKYMFLRTFAVPTGEDPDKISSAELDAKETPELIGEIEKETLKKLVTTIGGDFTNGTIKKVCGMTWKQIEGMTKEQCGVLFVQLNKQMDDAQHKAALGGDGA